MIRGRNICLVVLSIGVVAISCRKLYMPVLSSASNSYLVVEGIIDPGADSTFISLSHTVNIADSVGIAKETDAIITVEGKGITHALTEIKPGVYSALPLNLTIGQKYHLRIKLRNGKEYVSDDEDAKLTPPIDTLTFDTKNDVLQINASAHDPKNNTHYYRWDYEDTWRFNAKYYSSYKLVLPVDTVAPRTPAEDVFSCFASGKSTSIITATSIKLQQDVIAGAPIVTISATSEKIGIRYSALIKQYALTKDGFDFYENIKKNTEKLGSIFDAQPSELSGNIHNITDPAEPVIGFVDVSTVQTKRIFIDKEALPATWQVTYPYDCTNDTTLYNNPKTKIAEVKAYILTNLTMPTQSIKNENDKILGYYRTDFICGDCTLRGAKKRPAFWKDK